MQALVNTVDLNAVFLAHAEGLAAVSTKIDVFTSRIDVHNTLIDERINDSNRISERYLKALDTNQIRQQDDVQALRQAMSSHLYDLKASQDTALKDMSRELAHNENITRQGLDDLRKEIALAATRAANRNATFHSVIQWPTTSTVLPISLPITKIGLVRLPDETAKQVLLCLQQTCDSPKNAVEQLSEYLGIVL